MPTADVEGTTLYYDEAGGGQVALVMHGGLGMDHSYFRPAFDRLGDRLHLVYYDHRCNGRSARPALETQTMEQLADDAAALAQHVGAEQIVAIGHSYGGFVAQEFALRHPDRLRGLILIGTTPGQLGTGEDPADSEGPPPPAEFLELISTPYSDEAEYSAMFRKVLPHYFHRPEAVDLDALADGMITHAVSAMYSMMVLAQWSSVDRLGHIAVPALLLVGEYDVFTSPPQSRRIANRIADAEVVELPNAGHFPWFEEPELFFAAIERWLQSRELAGPHR